jgi:hypothetical protein
VAGNTIHAQFNVPLILLKGGLLKVAVLAGSESGRLAGLAQLHNPGMRIMAGHAFQEVMFSQEHTAILFVMTDKAVLEFDLIASTELMAFTTGIRVPVDVHIDSLGVTSMQAARAMTGFTLHAGFGPGARNPRQIILVTARAETGSVAGAAVVRKFGFASMELNKPTGFTQGSVGEVVLV